MGNKTILKARVKKNDIPKIYKSIAGGYDLWGSITETKARNRCLELASINDKESVLEVAVGTGLSFTEILKSNPHGRNEGIDLTKEMLEKAEEKALLTGQKNYHLKIGDAYNLDYPDSTFDVLINNYMFDLLPEEDFKDVLAEFKRVLRPGGRLVMVNMALSENWFNNIWKGLYQIKPSLLGGCRGVSLVPYLETVGFKNLNREFISQMTFPSEVVFGIK
jgi:ubiquinone/menaquinone biosynthesis C-methylase UbiE